MQVMHLSLSSTSRQLLGPLPVQQSSGCGYQMERELQRKKALPGDNRENHGVSLLGGCFWAQEGEESSWEQPAWIS